MKNHITQKELKELVNYNPETGIMTWKVNIGPNGKIDKQVGYINNVGYWFTSIKCQRYLFHRLIWIFVNGSFEYDSIDHIDHNPLNNKINNLRNVSHKQNLKNRKLSSNNTSGFHGVIFNKQASNWKAVIEVNSKRINLGHFLDKSDAIKARKHAERLYKFHTNHGE